MVKRKVEATCQVPARKMAEDAELLGVSWKDEQWLQQWALTADNVLAYFAHSQARAPRSALHGCGTRPTPLSTRPTSLVCCRRTVLRSHVHQRADEDAAQPDAGADDRDGQANDRGGVPAAQRPGSSWAAATAGSRPFALRDPKGPARGGEDIRCARPVPAAQLHSSRQAMESSGVIRPHVCRPPCLLSPNAPHAGGAHKPQETPIRFYYVLDGTVYEVPTVADVLRARVTRLSYHLSSAFAEYFKQDDKPDEPEPPSETVEKSAAAPAAAPAAASGGDGASRKRPRESSGVQ